MASSFELRQTVRIRHRSRAAYFAEYGQVLGPAAIDRWFASGVVRCFGKQSRIIREL